MAHHTARELRPIMRVSEFFDRNLRATVMPAGATGGRLKFAVFDKAKLRQESRSPNDRPRSEQTRRRPAPPLSRFSGRRRAAGEQSLSIALRRSCRHLHPSLPLSLVGGWVAEHRHRGARQSRGGWVAPECARPRRGASPCRPGPWSSRGAQRAHNRVVAQRSDSSAPAVSSSAPARPAPHLPTDYRSVAPPAFRRSASRTGRHRAAARTCTAPRP
jgi:hypothetical protein